MNVNRNVNRNANVNVNRNVNVNVGGVGYHGGVYRGAWVGRPYRWAPGGAIAAGAAIGFIAAGTAVAWAPPPPQPGLCWYYTDAAAEGLLGHLPVRPVGLTRGPDLQEFSRRVRPSLATGAPWGGRTLFSERCRACRARRLEALVVMAGLDEA